MKKFISVFLCTVIFTVNVIFMPYATTVYASDLVGNVVKSISFDNVVKMVKSLYKVGYNVATTGSGDGAASSKALDSIWGEDSAVNKWLQTKLFPFMDSSGNIDLTKDACPISYDNEKQLVEFNPTFTTELNQQLQDSIHALDGYWLYEPTHSFSDLVPITKAKFHEKYSSYDIRYSFVDSDAFDTSFLSFLNDTCSVAFFPFKYGTGSSEYVSRLSPYVLDKNVSGFDSEYYIALYKNSPCIFPKFGSLSDAQDLHIYNSYINNAGTAIEKKDDGITGNRLYQYINYSTENMYGSPFRIFYSFEDLQNFWNKGRTYVPQLPSGGFKVNIKYINNTTNLPDITYNINTTNKTETEIQNQFDTTFNNYLNDLNDFTDGGGTINPTPTPSGGGSGGDFGDGTTPTPKPDFTDGSLTDTNTLLQKILDKLTEFSVNHDKLAKTITDYIQKNDGKLEEILIAIQALSDGKTETEQNGCKYDFTVLSEYLTKLWNDSDKKFDEMVKLLEENNKYQQKLVDSLNEIKALLIADTVMDFFKDRSQETAEKAKDKFPTSIPWDISLVLNSMSAEPKNPKFSLPIKIESFKINETIDIDLSTDEWEKLAKTCRYILSVTFILFLIHLSRKLFSNGGDD